jgi:hypothetical protein
MSTLREWTIQEVGNNLGTRMCEIHAEPRSFGQDKRRRINNIHNQSYFDTVEVIGSIPVAPTTLSTLYTIRSKS